MQFYNFIFLARSWASDRLHLAESLSWLGTHAEKHDIPLTFILYPEGTLVSKDTRPISKKYADKLGIVSGSYLIAALLLTHSRMICNTRYYHGLQACTTPSAPLPRAFMTSS